MRLIPYFIVSAVELIFFIKNTSARSFAATSIIHRQNIEAKLVGDAVDMTSGQNGTYPRANLLHDGSVIATYSSVIRGIKLIFVTKSTDSGLSWQQIGIVTSGLFNSTDIDNQYILELPSNRLIVAVRNHIGNPLTGIYTLYRITVYYSDDGGVNWEWLSEPASVQAAAIKNGVWEPFLRNAGDGVVQIYYSKENSAVDQDTVMQTSYNGGITWTAASTISGANITSRDGMTGVTTTTSPTNLLAVFESEQNGLFTIDSIQSPDNGMTWQNRSRVYTPLGKNNNAGAPQVINVGGLLICSFTTDEDTMEHAWFNGSDAKIIISGDLGRSWLIGSKITVFGVQRSSPVSPGMVTLDEKNFLVMADYFGAKSQRVSLV